MKIHLIRKFSFANIAIAAKPSITGLLMRAAMVGGLLFGAMGGIESSMAQSASEKSLGAFKNWTAYVYDNDDGRICTMWSTPTKSEGNYTRRGKIWAFVTHRPDINTQNELVFQQGYAVDGDKAVTLTIDGKKMEGSYTQDETIFYHIAQSTDIVNAMRRGNSMIMKSISSRGTLTTDRYSLLGFTAAHRAITEACAQ
ncbi:MAG: invasion associated locus B family protein [Alphaproteobacteria bacterium]